MINELNTSFFSYVANRLCIIIGWAEERMPFQATFHKSNLLEIIVENGDDYALVVSGGKVLTLFQELEVQFYGVYH